MHSNLPSPNHWSILAISTVVVGVSLTVCWRHETLRQHDSANSRFFGTSNDDGDDSFELPPHLKREIDKEQRRQEKIPMLAMKKPMYDNIQMLDPRGTLLCTISKKKANWYIKKKLAIWKDTQKMMLQLLFEPSHRSNQSMDEDVDDDKFFNKSIKDNVCVVCGHEQYHMRHYIVPYSCRSLFPDRYKMHMAHDVVILCPDCHLVGKKLATQRMKFLEKQCRTDPNTGISHFVDREMYKIKSCALALLNRKDQLPTKVIQQYEAHVRQYANLADHKELTISILQNASNVITEIANPDYIPTAEIIVQSFCKSDAEIEIFVKDWRKYFLDTMQPQYLPKGWDVDSSVQCQSAERRSRS